MIKEDILSACCWEPVTEIQEAHKNNSGFICTDCKEECDLVIRTDLRDVWKEDVIDAVNSTDESVEFYKEQIDRLGDYIEKHHKEKIGPGGAVDNAIRIMRELTKKNG